MKTEHNIIDELLKGLADYKPPAAPDWDSFYTDYQNNIANSAGSDKKAVKHGTVSIVLKSSLIAIVALSGIIAGYFLIFSNNAATDAPANNQSLELPSVSGENDVPLNTTVLPQNGAAPDANEVLNSPGLQHENISHVSGSKPDAETSSVNAAPATDLKTDETAVDNDSEPPVAEEEYNRDSLAEPPVIIKKTVIISDTLKIKRPAKK